MCIQGRAGQEGGREGGLLEFAVGRGWGFSKQNLDLAFEVLCTIRANAQNRVGKEEALGPLWGDMSGVSRSTW